MSSDRRPTDRRSLAGGLLATLLACAALLGTGAPARAEGTPAAGSVNSVVDALRTGPVYVDPAFAAAVTAAQQKELADRIAATGLPIKVVLLPLNKGDAFDGKSKSLAAVVNERLGQPQLILLTNDDYGSWLTGTEWPADTHQARDSAAAVGFLKELKDAGLAARVGRAIDLIASGKGTEVYKAEIARMDRERSARPHTDGAGSGSSSDGGPTGLLVAGVAVPAVLVAAGSYLVVRRRRAPRHTAFSFPDAVFAADRAADEAGLRRQAAAEVLALGEAVNGADGATTPGLTRALDAYDAAGRVLDGARDIPDLAGVLALAAEGRAALATEPRLPLCFFDPRHGAAAGRTDWRPLGRRERVDVAVCADCSQALRGRRAPQVLAVRDQGRTVPYFEVPAERSLWAATGYGSLLSGPEDTLAARVGTGQFSRARQQPADTED
ncbi:hypothetical protein [Kitasatospora cheerisanensis]|uniref:TPM domain-containing protein n=1 Tax=Kitasatospora cheerisanensis KCTC 2395 TaxID=1348663 RepID=A0A066YXV8_9ACTN|nr:hypothetical protein [Kitasatospora cheerisanensis]KDN86072.1 hypothetical protein KCH_18890 [Kitasatospora cheerisanensis KCTC 2395]